MISLSSTTKHKFKTQEVTFFKGKHLNINQFDENFYDEVMGEYITMTLSDDEGDDYYNKEISMDACCLSRTGWLQSMQRIGREREVWRLKI
jgi:hypothetical protein